MYVQYMRVKCVIFIFTGVSAQHDLNLMEIYWPALRRF
jgi:hypothetical protein